VEQVESIKEAFAGTVGGLMCISAQNIRVQIVPDGGCTITKVHTPFSHHSEDNGAVSVLIPDAFAGERRDVVVEVSVPVSAADSVDGTVPILRATARYRALRERGQVQMPEVCLYAARTEEPEGEPDEEVTVQRQRIEVSNALQEAIQHGEEGRFTEAQDMLERNLTKLRSSSAQNVTSQALISELDDARCRLSSAADWRDGGLAELNDAVMMHRTQRCTKMSSSRSDRQRKCSRSLYLQDSQMSAIRRSIGTIA